MTLRRKYLTFLLLILISIFIYSCIDISSDAVVPEWDVDLTIPIIQEYNLGELLEKNKNLDFSYDSQKDSLIVYNTSIHIEPIKVFDKENLNLKISPIHKKILISEIKFQLDQEFIFNFKINDVFDNLQVGTNAIVNPIQPVTINRESKNNDYQEFELDSGKLFVTFNNQFPFDLRCESIKIINNTNDNKTEIGVIGSKVITPKSTIIDSSILLTGKNISNNVIMNLFASTPGSGGNSVYLTANDLFSVKINIKDAKIKFAKAIILPQTYNQSNSFFLSDISLGSNISELIFETGQLNTKINNYTQLSGVMSILFPELISGEKQYLIDGLNISRGQSTFQKTYDLSRMTIYPRNNEVTSRTTVVTNNTNPDMVIINANDSVVYDFSIENLSIYSFSGSIVSHISKSLYLSSEEIEKYFKGNITLSDASIIVTINNGTNLPCQFKNGLLSAYNKVSGRYESLTIDYTEFNPKSTNNIYLNRLKTTDFLNKFTKNATFPKEFAINGDLLINTANNLYRFTSSDTIGGFITIRIPLKINIQNYIFSDTTKIEVSDSDKEQMDKFNKCRLTINTINRIGTSAGLKMNFLDKSKQGLLSLPLKPYLKQSDSLFTIRSANVDNSGLRISSVESNFIIEILKQDILKIKNSEYCELKFYLNTSPNTLVEFKKKDAIKVKILSEFGYRISN